MYRDRIAQLSGESGRTLAWIEAWMRLEHSELDGLSRSQFAAEVKIAQQCIAASTDAENEALAKSMVRD